MAASEETTEEKSEEIITAVYKVNLHCKQCVREIRQPLMRAQGVRKVDCDIESGTIKVNGTMIDVVKMHKRIEKLSKKKVELVSPKPKIIIPEVTTEKKIVNKETIKEAVVRKTTVKVHMHCEKCEQDLRTMLLRHKGIYRVKTDFKGQTLIVEGSIESERLVSYIRNKIGKHAEIVIPKQEEKKLDEEVVKEINKATTTTTASAVVVAEDNNVAVKKSTNTTTRAKTVTKSVEIVEFKEEEEIKKQVVAGVKDEKGNNIPYFVHYVYAPQIFSDENPHACSIM